METQHFCTHCGSPINDDMQFCPRCGREIRNDRQGFSMDDNTRTEFTPEVTTKVGHSTDARRSLIFGFVSFFLALFGIPAIIYGLRDKEDEWSLAGMIMGVCACIVLTIDAVLSIMSLF